MEISPRASKCSNFFTTKEGKPFEVSTIVVPVKTVDHEDGSHFIAWSCSLGSTCQCTYCRFSAYSREQRQIEGKDTWNKDKSLGK